MTYQTLEEVIKLADCKQHPYGAVWQLFDERAFRELVENIDRRGLDKEITRYQGMILEGWHRYLACLATKITPKFADFNGDDLNAAEFVHASGIRRHSSADQRYASFVQLCEACPEFNAKYEALKAKGVDQQKAGQPLDTSGERVNVIEAKAAAAGVGPTTAKKVERVRKFNPSAVAEIAAGTTTANKELNKFKKKKKPHTAKAKAKNKIATSAQATEGDITITAVYKSDILSKFESVLEAGGSLKGQLYDAIGKKVGDLWDGKAMSVSIH